MSSNPKIMKKNERHRKLLDAIRQNPFITDEELAEILQVSIPTVRLDRMELAIPEVRKRTREMASQFFGVSQSLANREIVGELIEIEPGKKGLSFLDTDRSMCLEKCNIVRGHIIFAMANTLANAVAAAQVAVTGKAELDFLRTVRAGEKLIAKAQILEKRGHRFFIEVIVRCKEEIVCKGTFVIHGMSLEMAHYLKLLKDED
ncbi:acyl-coenzyme A thioesterase PaaI-like protein [Hydrogenispora ethanolica]|uniref:Acyl-coenzyme A thioesterase PaaI-like protein n=1 Tax=Hydrogenispora ethanolica TaxID=1082276 RepID=A0A4R1RB86_HYDET|nr:transcription factor FapR [Hydrogenispora ethanolica]TCL63043.1 acyl-coenzyme A thioesterase PaaI-like protein [Hydrogenispora ethanolica]